MFLFQVFALLLVIGLVTVVLAILSLPFVVAALLVVVAVKLALFVVLLPFRFLGWAFGLALGR